MALKRAGFFFFFSTIPNRSGQRLEGCPPLINRSFPVVAGY
jgi:hypothetical protein